MSGPLRFVRLREGAVLPSRSYPGDAGLDLHCFAGVIDPDETRDCSVGVAVSLPDGYWARIVGRSSALRRLGLLVNEGVIDCGYTGELFVSVRNMGVEPCFISEGQRLAQLILHQVELFEPEWGEIKVGSSRGTNGFGSSGV